MKQRGRTIGYGCRAVWETRCNRTEEDGDEGEADGEEDEERVRPEAEPDLLEGHRLTCLREQQTKRDSGDAKADEEEGGRRLRGGRWWVRGHCVRLRQRASGERGLRLLEPGRVGTVRPPPPVWCGDVVW